MAEYIERDKVADLFDDGKWQGQICIDAMMEIPAADVAPVVHGRWDDAPDGDGAVCSACGADFCTIVHEVDRFSFCPNCGAKMDKEE